jgi:hypothetical protein
LKRIEHEKSKKFKHRKIEEDEKEEEKFYHECNDISRKD